MSIEDPVQGVSNLESHHFRLILIVLRPIMSSYDTPFVVLQYGLGTEWFSL
jgi:hypothetical protein